MLENWRAFFRKYSLELAGSGHGRHSHVGHRGLSHLRHASSGRSLSTLHLGKESSGFSNLLLEFRVVGEIELGLLEGQVNEHTGNLGGELLGAQLSYEVENGVSDLGLEMRVLSLDGRNDLQGVGVVSRGLGVLVRSTHLLLVLHRHVHLRHGHGRLSLLLASHVVHVHATTGRVVAVSVHHVAATFGVHVTVLSLLSIMRSLAAVVVVVVTSLVVSLLSTVVSTALLERVEALSLHGEGLEELSDLVVELISG